MNEIPPQLIGMPTRIRLISQIGSGVTSTVWLARDTREGVDIAVKILSPTENSRRPDPNGSRSDTDERFEREVRSLSRLRGRPGIASIRDVGVAADGTRWLAMDLASGGSLRERMTRPGEPPGALQFRKMADAVATQVGSALATAHSLDVLHGDISPANILFSTDEQMLLGDFGMSSLAGGGLGAHGVAGLTPAYAAPERLRGAPASKAADVFSLASVIIELHRISDEAGQGEDVTEETPDGTRRRSVLEAANSTVPSERPDAQALVEAFRSESRGDSGRRRGRGVIRRWSRGPESGGGRRLGDRSPGYRRSNGPQSD